MQELYKQIRDILLGEGSIDLYFYGGVFLLVAVIVSYILFEKCHSDNKKSFYGKCISYSYPVQKECSKQLLIMILIYYVTQNVDKDLNQYLFIVFILLSFRTFVNIEISKRWSNDIEYVFLCEQLRIAIYYMIKMLKTKMN